MRKEELIEAIRKAQRAAPRKSAENAAQRVKADARSAKQIRTVAKSVGTKISGTKTSGAKTSGAKTSGAKISGGKMSSAKTSRTKQSGTKQREAAGAAPRSSGVKKQATAESTRGNLVKEKKVRGSAAKSGSTKEPSGKQERKKEEAPKRNSVQPTNKVPAKPKTKAVYLAGAQLASVPAQLPSALSSSASAKVRAGASSGEANGKKNRDVRGENGDVRGERGTRRSESRPKVEAVKVSRPPTSPRIVKVLRKQQAAAESRKDLSACVRVHESAVKNSSGLVSGGPRSVGRADRIVLIVRDSYWLQACWEIDRSSIERARAAMSADWHTAQPVLRLMEVAQGATVNTAERLVRDIPIHGGVNNWYIDVENPPTRYRVLIGYRASSGKFYTLCRSNLVQTPEPGACDPIEGHWEEIAEDYERIYSLSEHETGSGSNELREMFEERLQRPMLDLSGEASLAAGNDMSLRRERDLPFEVDAELIVYGTTTPGASVTLGGKPVKLSPDGSFTVRMELPDRRQVIPVVACSRDGLRQRTTVVAVERNTKVMEAVSKHNME